MIEHIAMARLGSDDDSPFDDTRCAGCSLPFGMELGQAQKSTMLPELCTECYRDLEQAYDGDRAEDFV